MNSDKFTRKSVEALQQAQTLAISRRHSQLDEEHLLYALLHQENGLISQLLVKLGIDPSAFGRELDRLLDSMPTVTGSAEKVYLSAEVDQAIAEAENQAGRMKDDFVSVEHLMLGLFAKPKVLLEERLEMLRRALGA